MAVLEIIEWCVARGRVQLRSVIFTGAAGSRVSVCRRCSLRHGHQLLLHALCARGPEAPQSAFPALACRWLVFGAVQISSSHCNLPSGCALPACCPGHRLCSLSLADDRVVLGGWGQRTPARQGRGQAWGDCNKLPIRVTLEKISQGEISLRCLNIVSKQ